MKKALSPICKYIRILFSLKDITDYLLLILFFLVPFVVYIHIFQVKTLFDFLHTFSVIIFVIIFFVYFSLTKINKYKLILKIEKNTMAIYSVYTRFLPILYNYLIFIFKYVPEEDKVVIKNITDISNKYTELLEELVKEKNIVQEFEMLIIPSKKLYELVEEIEHHSQSIFSKLEVVFSLIFESFEVVKKKYFINFNKKIEAWKTIVKMAHYLGFGVEFLRLYIQNINQFSDKKLIEVINNFYKISNYASDIEKEIEKSISELLAENNKNSFINMEKEAKDLSSAFQMFYSDLTELKNSSYNFIETTISNLKEIEKINVEIQKIAKTMNIISINIGIEAANAGSEAKGFKVLANDIRNFANKTNEFVISVKKRIDETIKNTSNLKNDYEFNLKKVFSYVEVIKNYLSNLETSLNSSIPALKDAVFKLKDFAKNLDTNVKESIVELQSYDIVKQETEHIENFINFIFNEYIFTKEKLKIPPEIEKSEKKDILSDILSYVDTIITTGNERKILELIKKKYNIEDKTDSYDQPESDGSFIILR